MLLYNFLQYVSLCFMLKRLRGHFVSSVAGATKGFADHTLWFSALSPLCFDLILMWSCRRSSPPPPELQP